MISDERIEQYRVRINSLKRTNYEYETGLMLRELLDERLELLAELGKADNESVRICDILRKLLNEREELLQEHAAWEAMRNGTIDTVRRLDTGGYRAVLGRRHDRVNRRCAYDHYGDPVQAALAAAKAAKEAIQKQETPK